MTATDVPSPPPPAPTRIGQPVVAGPPKPPISVMAVISLALIVLTSIGYMTAKTLVPVFDNPSFEKQVNTIADVFGVLGFLSIVPIAASIVLGHLAARATSGPRRGRALGIAGLSVGYLLLALYFNRIIVSIIAVAVFPHGADFLDNNFFWA
ncbi:MAG TPA: hypothetical protein VHZ81_12950 [Galbitalea sp.]|nr:hypothetical protein [Galbitalea sp.]